MIIHILAVSIMLLTGLSPTLPVGQELAEATVLPPDTLAVEDFKALFPYQGEGVVPDSVEWINCEFLLPFAEMYFHSPPYDWERYRLSIQGEIRDLPFYGMPYSLSKRQNGKYLATFFFIDGETSPTLGTKVLDEAFRIVEDSCEVPSCGDLAYCGGDAGYEWHRDGRFVNDSVYVFRSILLDEQYDTTWAAFVWDREGKLRVETADPWRE